MGFSTTINYRTGREVLACDFCSNYPARKVRCPYNYCQAWAICGNCRTAGKHKSSSNGGSSNHAQCKIDSLEFERKQRERAENASKVVASAWGDWLTHMPQTCLVVTVSGDYYLVPQEHYRTTTSETNRYIDDKYTPATKELAEILINACYGTKSA